MLKVFNTILNVRKKTFRGTTGFKIAKLAILSLALNEFYCHVDFFWYADAHYASHDAFFRVDVY